MRVLICGDRNWTDRKAIRDFVSGLPFGSVVIEGEAKGADSIARDVAGEQGFMVMPFPANWKLYGRAAGPIRNKQMLTEGKPDLVVAFHNDIDSSRGTANMVDQARKAGIETKVMTSG